MKNYLTVNESRNLENPILSVRQIAEIRKKTPKSEIETITENGKTFKSVKANFAKKKLNQTFGWDFDFQIISKEYITYSKEVSVQCRLTIRVGEKTIIREQFGEFQTNGKGIATAYKSAATNALKKIMSELGFFWDIYGEKPEIIKEEKPEIIKEEEPEIIKEEEPEMTYQQTVISENTNRFLAGCKTIEDIEKVIEGNENGGEIPKFLLPIFEKHKKRLLLD